MELEAKSGPKGRKVQLTFNPEDMEKIDAVSNQHEKKWATMVKAIVCLVFDKVEQPDMSDICRVLESARAEGLISDDLFGSDAITPEIVSAAITTKLKKLRQIEQC